MEPRGSLPRKPHSMGNPRNISNLEQTRYDGDVTVDARRRYRRAIRIEWFAWLGAFLIAALVLPAVGFESRDPDSHLYAFIASRLATLPVSHWLTPEWWGAWNTEGLFREHPVGIFLLPALLGKLGYPALQASYLANALYQILTLIVVQRVAAFLVMPIESRALAWMLQLLPIAFTYRIRGNQEQAVLLFIFVALWGTERSRRDGHWIAVTAFAVVATMLVKDIFVALVLMCCALWLLLVRHTEDAQQGDDRRAWLGLGLSVCAALAVGIGYELSYRHITHESFVSVYVSRVVVDAVRPHGNGGWSLFRKLYNLVWYSGRVLWFALPASVVAIVAAWKWRRELAARLSPRSPGTDSATATATARTIDGLAFTMVVSLVVLVGLSLSDRDADRYIFSVYYVLGACGMVAALRAWPTLGQWTRNLDRYGAIVPAALWVITFGMTLASVALRLPRIVIGPPR